MSTRQHNCDWPNTFISVVETFYFVLLHALKLFDWYQLILESVGGVFQIVLTQMKSQIMLNLILNSQCLTLRLNNSKHCGWKKSAFAILYRKTISQNAKRVLKSFFIKIH